MNKKNCILVVFLISSCFNFAHAKDKEYTKNDDIKTNLEYINYEWWLTFGDMNLEQYIFKGLLNNSDLKVAKLKIEEYKKYVKYTFGQELPTISANFNYSDIKKIPINNTNLNQDGILLPLTVGYELDLFGKNRKKTYSVKKQLESYQLQLQATYISFVSNLSTLYFNIMKLNELIDYYDQFIDINEEIIKSTEIKEKNGLLTTTEINKLKQDIKTLINEKTNLLKNRDSLLTQFTIMLGENPNKSVNVKVTKLNDLKITNNLILPISSDIIFKRPDVLAYEKEMEKAKIDIEIARKEFLPTITINGSFIFNNMSSGGFFSAANTIRSLVAGASQNLFVGGRKKANLDMVNIRYEQMFENYRKITLQAIKEINDGLTDIIYDEKINEENEQRVGMELDNYSTYKIKYKNGLISYIDLLKLKQQLIKTKIDFSNSKIQNYIDYISLYKSVAGQIN